MRAYLLLSTFFERLSDSWIYTCILHRSANDASCFGQLIGILGKPRETGTLFVIVRLMLESPMLSIVSLDSNLKTVIIEGKSRFNLGGITDVARDVLACVMDE